MTVPSFQGRQLLLAPNGFHSSDVSSRPELECKKRQKTPRPSTRGWLSSEFRWTPHPVIVTIRDNRDHITRSSYIPIIPLLQGGGSSYIGMLFSRSIARPQDDSPNMPNPSARVRRAQPSKMVMASRPPIILPREWR